MDEEATLDLILGLCETLLCVRNSDKLLKLFLHPIDGKNMDDFEPRKITGCPNKFCKKKSRTTQNS